MVRTLAGLALVAVACGAAMSPSQELSLQQPGPAGARRERKGSSKAMLALVLGSDLAHSSSLPIYLLFALSDFLSFVAIYIPYTHLPPLAKVPR